MKDHLELDLARLAAYIDGEGSISIHHATIAISVSNTDPRLIQWINERFEAFTYRYHGQSRTRRWMFRWEIRAGKAADLLTLLMPYFVIKKQQAELAVAFYSTVKRGRGGNHMKAMHPEILAVRKEMEERMLFLHHDAPGNPNLREVN